MPTTWPPVNESDACNSDLVVAIIEVIAGKMILTENHLISLEDLFRLNPKQSETKNYEKERWVPSPSYLYQTHLRGRRRGALGGGVATTRPWEQGRQRRHFS